MHIHPEQGIKPMKSSATRRTFFGAMGAAASLAAIAIAKKPIAAPVALPTALTETSKKGYQLSEHVKRYYRSTVA
jgi:hypothetical protein